MSDEKYELLMEALRDDYEMELRLDAEAEALEDEYRERF